MRATSAQVAVVLSIFATFVTILNVLLTGYLTRRTEHQSWRREVLLPTFAAFLAATDRHQEAADLIAESPSPTTPAVLLQDQAEAAAELKRSLAKLELVAPRQAALVAKALQHEHDLIDHAIVFLTRPPGPSTEIPDEYRDPERWVHILRTSLSATPNLRTTFLRSARRALGTRGVVENPGQTTTKLLRLASKARRS